MTDYSGFSEIGVSLDGKTITNDLRNPFLFRFGPSDVIAPHGFLVVRPFVLSSDGGEAGLFDGSHVVEQKTHDLVDAATAELDDVLALGGAFEAIDELKGRLVRSHTERVRRIENGELAIITDREPEHTRRTSDTHPVSEDRRNAT